MVDYLPVEEGHAALIRRMTDPGIRIVALTVTEGGYYIDPATKGLDTAHPDIRHDAATPDRPRTAFGAMVAALRIRRDRGIGPFTAQSCDNLQGNGAVLRRTVVSLARACDPDLAGLDRRELHVSQLDGRLHRARDRPEGARAGAGARESTTRFPSPTRTSVSG